MSLVIDDYRREISLAVEKTLERIKSEKNNNASIDPGPISRLQDSVKSVVNSIYPDAEISAFVKLSVPPQEIAADFALASFPMAKALKKSPQEIAGEIASAVNKAGISSIEKAEAAGPYVNFFVDRKKFYCEILNYVSSSGEDYGRTFSNRGKTVVIDYSSPNIAKPLGVGHLRSTIIGQALGNIYEWTGWSVVRDNHLGDWGTQFGELIYAYETWSEGEIKQDHVRKLKDLYVKFHQEVKENPALKDEARAIFKRLEDGDDELFSLWKKFRDWSIDGFNSVYKRLGVHFDLYIGESYFAPQTAEVIKECLENGLAKKEENSSVVFVDQLEGLPSFILRKEDGTSLYITRDLAAVKFRVDTFAPGSLLYVVGSEQSLSFKQMFALARKLGYLPENVKAEHIEFGMVLSNKKKMSTRHGTIVELEEVMQKAVERAAALLRENNKDLTDSQIADIAEIIGIGAVIYNDLRQSREKNISFDWERSIRLEAGSCAYLQYAYVRVKSILSKLGQVKNPSSGWLFEHPKEFALAKKIMLFPSIIEQAQENNATHLLCTYLEELAQQFNSFYADVQIINTADPDLLASRTALINAAARVIENGLKLMEIRVPDRM